jgi:hypothetical protein
MFIHVHELILNIPNETYLRWFKTKMTTQTLLNNNNYTGTLRHYSLHVRNLGQVLYRFWILNP